MLLDTNALSAFADGDAGLAPIVKQTKRISVPVVALGEYRFGIRQSRNREYYEAWLKAQSAHWEVLCVDELTTIHYATVRFELKQKGRPIPANDMWIAAATLETGSCLLTFDADFASVQGLDSVLLEA